MSRHFPPLPRSGRSPGRPAIVPPASGDGARLRALVSALLTALLVLGAAGAVLAPGLPGLPGGTARAQGQLVEKVARVEVPVYEDNLDDAKSRAVHQGQISALRSLVDELVAPEWVTLFDKEIRSRILGRLDRYVSSYRVQRSVTSADRTRYLVALSAQINRGQLVEDLHDLSLPVAGDPPTTVSLVWAGTDPALGDAALRSALETALDARLKLLNFTPGPLHSVGATQAAPLADPTRPAPERAAAMARERATTVLFVGFRPAPPPAAEAAEPAQASGPSAVAYLYERASGRLLASFEQQARGEPLALPPAGSQGREQVQTRLVTPLVAQMQPAAIRADAAAAGDAASLRLRVLGLRSVEEQEQFEQAFFKRNSPFEHFSLRALGAHAVTYQGPYRGDRGALDKELRGQTVGRFTIRQVYWYNNVLELALKAQPPPPPQEMRLFPKEVRSPEVAAIIDDYLGRFTQLEVEDPLYAESEDNGWLDRANPLPLDATVYGYLDARSDSDFYQADAVAAGGKYELVWHRISRTNLSPAVRFYDEEGRLVFTFTPKSWLRYVYTVPKGQHRFYIEVADRFGYVRIDTGGYLNFHYLFKLRRK